MNSIWFQIYEIQNNQLCNAVATLLCFGQMRKHLAAELALHGDILAPRLDSESLESTKRIFRDVDDVDDTNKHDEETLEKHDIAL